MEIFVVRALQKIKKITNSRRQKVLRDSCDNVLDKLANLGIDINNNNITTPSPMNTIQNPDTDADKYFEPFMLACQTRHPKIMDAALDCLQKLLAYGYLRGANPIPESLIQTNNNKNNNTKVDGTNNNQLNGIENKKLIDKIVETICECNDHPDEQVQLQVLKSLVTAVTSSTCEVHDLSLLTAIRACYHIHLVSKNMMNQTVAKATLQQMLNIIFQRMENFDQRIQIEIETSLQQDTMISSNINKNNNKNNINKVQNTLSNIPITAGFNVAEDTILHDQLNENEKKLVDEMQKDLRKKVENIRENKNYNTNEVGNVSNVNEKKEEKDNVMCTSTLYPGTIKILQFKTISFHSNHVESFQLHSESFDEKKLIKQEKEAFLDRQNSIANAATTSFPSILHKDAFLVFRSLCRLSMRTLSEDPLETTLQTDPIALQSKCLSLELLHSILVNAGPSFRNGDKFIYAIKQYLCVSLLSNCTSSYTQVMELSLKIFVVLIQNFKVYLKKEIEIFISNIFLKILESMNSTTDHKLLVLEVLYNICQDNVILSEIFLNYDCDWDSMDLFKRIVHALSKSAKINNYSSINNQNINKKNAGNKTTIQMNKSNNINQNQNSTNLAGSNPTFSNINVSGNNNVNNENSLSTSSSSNMKLKMTPQEGAFELRSLECFVAILRSLKKASNFIELDAKTNEKLVNKDEEEDDENDLTSPNTANNTNSSNTLSVVEAFDRKQRIKQELSTGILKFNVKPTLGIQYLISHNHIKNTPTDVARFLLEYNHSLDKTMIGEYLGREVQYQNGFCLKVLHEFVDQMDFANLEFDTAIRHFLQTFRLPGEAQKIDRIMEKFAERYCLDNCNNNNKTNVFESADTAFILAFSVIMLQTDLHNPNVQKDKKMEKNDFIKNNRGINGGKDLPEEFLGNIYDRIAINPFTLKEDDEYKKNNDSNNSNSNNSRSQLFKNNDLNSTNNNLKREAFIKEREAMVRMSEQAIKQKKTNTNTNTTGNINTLSQVNPTSFGETNLLKKRVSMDSSGNIGSSNTANNNNTNRSKYYHVNGDKDANYVRPMFEIVWAPLLACISVLLEVMDCGSNNNMDFIYLCIEGFDLAIYLSSRFKMNSERDAFVTSLAKFTTLYTVKDMDMKNIECIKGLLVVTLKNGNYLGDSWRECLQCISQLARLQMHAQGMQPDMEFFFSNNNNTKNNNKMNESNGSNNSLNNNHSISSPNDTHTNLYNTGNNSATINKTSNTNNKRTGVPTGGGNSFFGSSNTLNKEQIAKIVEENNAELILNNIDILATDRIFSSSMNLNDMAIHEFVQNLCVVSLSEVSGALAVGNIGQMNTPDTSQPRIFCLQKLVEVADMNMEIRSRMVWSSVWKILTRHFTTIGCHENTGIAMYAIDSLRQLSMRFLEKNELKDFNFQRLFLRPFEIIMSNNINIEIKEFILRSIENIILARYSNIRSGWKTILGVLAIAASENDIKNNSYNNNNNNEKELNNNNNHNNLVQIGFNIMSNLIDEHFECILEVYVDVVNGLYEFIINNNKEEIALGSLDKLDICFEKLVQGKVIEILQNANETNTNNDKNEVLLENKSVDIINGIYSDSEEHKKMYLPLLNVFKFILTIRLEPTQDEQNTNNNKIIHPLPIESIRIKSIEILFSNLEKYGNKFNLSLWKIILQDIVFYIFTDLNNNDNNKYNTKDKELICQYGISKLCTLYGNYYEIFGVILLNDFLNIFYHYIKQENINISIMSITSLEKWIFTYGHKFTKDIWNTICDSLHLTMGSLLPSRLFEPLTNNSSMKEKTSFDPSLEDLPLSPSNFDTFSIEFLKTKVSTVLHFQNFIGKLIEKNGLDHLLLFQWKKLIYLLESSFLLARDFNDCFELRKKFYKIGFFYGSDNYKNMNDTNPMMPDLLQQEIQGKIEFLRIVFIFFINFKYIEKRYKTDQDLDETKFYEFHKYLENNMATIIKNVFLDYLLWTNDIKMKELYKDKLHIINDLKKRVFYYTPLMVHIIEGFSNLSLFQIRDHLNWFYPLAIELIKTDNKEVRDALYVFYSGPIQEIIYK